MEDHCRKTPALSSRPSGQEDLPWTAARCLRLIRRARGLAASLQKLSPDVNGSEEVVPNKHSPVKRRASCHEAASAQQRSKRLKYTYSRRCRKRVRPAPVVSEDPKTPAKKPESAEPPGLPKALRRSPVAGQVSIASPLLRRALLSPLRQADETKYEYVPPLPFDTANRIAASATLQTLRSRVPASHYPIYEGLLGCLNDVLKCTGGGARQETSLLAACLRKLPGYLTEYEKRERETAVEEGTEMLFADPGASIRIYHELELHFSAAGNGWRPLRVLLRAHVISILQQSISARVLHGEFAEFLALHCMAVGATHEGLGLFEVLVRTGQVPVSRCVRELTTWTPLQRLTSTRLGKNQVGPVLACLSGLLQEGSIDVDWLCTADFTHGIWKMAMVDLASSSQAGPAIDFGATALGLLMCRVQTLAPASGMRRAMEQTMLSVVAVLTAVILTYEDRVCLRVRDGTMARGAATLVSGRAVTMFSRSLKMAPNFRSKRKASLGQYILALGIYILSTMAPGGSSLRAWLDLQEYSAAVIENCFLRAIAETPAAGKDMLDELYLATVGLVSSIAHSCGRLSSTPPHRYIADMELKLREPIIGVVANLFAGFRADCAFHVAGLTGDMRDLALAESLLVAVGGASVQARQAALGAGWRWEEGISEWVAYSPGTGATAPHVPPPPSPTPLHPCRPFTPEAPGDEDHDREDVVCRSARQRRVAQYLGQVVRAEIGEEHTDEGGEGGHVMVVAAVRTTALAAGARLEFSTATMTATATATTTTTTATVSVASMQKQVRENPEHYRKSKPGHKLTDGLGRPRHKRESEYGRRSGARCGGDMFPSWSHRIPLAAAIAAAAEEPDELA